ncbi:SIR2 family protein [Flagellimonas baculiformis]|uniref:hypothetical protein n=1 Tax=Flagellimonas baculiformis TaxID=3067310 RepID=UPI00296F5603|nr:hypothetical protein [Muricauda sp. D6]
MSKTVYILGAGFSIPAGAPTQAGLTKAIFKLKKKPIYLDNKILQQYFEKFEEFLERQLLVEKENLNDVALEDIFTPIDRCIIENSSYRTIEPKKLIEIREVIYNLIIVALRETLRTADTEYIDEFADFLIQKTHPRIENPKLDEVAVLTTNWDILLDNALKRKLRDLKKPNEDFEGVVDYCCYVSSLDRNDHSIKPGLYALGKGKFNIKLLKLHGSMNWLHCPKCQRVFVKFYEKIAGDIVFHNQHCRHCKNNYTENNNNSLKLRSNLIMPTFLKDLNNFQIKLIWQNAGVELSEADKIVFIGYSLPQADFELRQLLSRMIKDHVEIDVVLSEYDKPVKDFEWAFAEKRYESFFGNRKPKFYYSGVKEYLKNNNR